MSLDSHEQHVDISVLIPTCSRPLALARCLLEIESQISELLGRWHVEILVGEDCPQLSSANVNPALISLVRGPGRGPGANRNRLAHTARGRLLVFLDDDCIPQSGLLDAYIRAWQTHPRYSLFEGRITSNELPTLADQECPYNEKGGVFWSANIAITAAAFRQLGGFDEDYPFAAMEDVDLRVRAEMSSLCRKWTPEAVVLHPLERRSGSSLLLKKRYSILLFVRKHPDLISGVKANYGLKAAARFLEQRLLKRKLLQPFGCYLYLGRSIMSMLFLRLLLCRSGWIDREIQRLEITLHLQVRNR